MPANGLSYGLGISIGLVLVGMAIGLPFLIWRLVHGRAFAGIGIKPLALAYSCAALGLLFMSFIACCLQFGGQVTPPWPAFFWGTAYIAGMSLILVLPLLGLVGVPVAALLLKRDLLTPWYITVSVSVFWLSFSTVAWAFPDNAWHRTHRMESFVMNMKESLPGMLFIALPFMFAIYGWSHAYRHGGRNGR